VGCWMTQSKFEIVGCSQISCAGKKFEKSGGSGRGVENRASITTTC
jgi:hypothetical protein